MSNLIMELDEQYMKTPIYGSGITNTHQNVSVNNINIERTGRFFYLMYFKALIT